MASVTCHLFHLKRRIAATVAVVRPADDVDPDYGRALREAAAAGVEVVAVRARIERVGVEVGDEVCVDLT